MRIIPPKSDIELYKEGFDGNDKLDRAKIGKKISDLVEKIDDPLVIALDGAWGSGKTHFLRCWVGEHKLDVSHNAETVYLDAFEHDYLEDPLVALTLAIDSRFDAQSKSSKVWKLAKDAAAKLWRPALRTAVSAGTAGIVTRADDALDAAANTLSEEVTSRDFWEREEGKRNAMESFRSALLKLTDESDGPTRKLIIVVDELDRCRPDYALSMLEVIKHFFSVPSVHFILGVSLAELQNSVRARYGQGVNAETYLHKFVNLQFQLPQTVGSHDRTPVALEYFEQSRQTMKLPEDLARYVKTYLALRLEVEAVTLRDCVKILTQIAITSLPERRSHGDLSIIAGLIVLKHFEPSIYEKIGPNFSDFEAIRIPLSFQANSKTKREYVELQKIWRYATSSTPEKRNNADRSVVESFGPFGIRNTDQYFQDLRDSYLDAFSLPDDV